MTAIVLQRVTLTDANVFGVLLKNNIPLCVTLEEGWRNNQIGNSCIVPGVYQCRRHNGVRYQNVWEVMNVPGRSAILIHQGNTTDNTAGCILVGCGFSMFGVRPGVTNSLDTLNKLRTVLPSDFTIEIRNPT